MKLRGCGNSHFMWSIKDGDVNKVHNTDSHGRPGLRFKKLEDIHESADGEYTSLVFAERKTRVRSSYAVEEDEPDCPSSENDVEELTSSQLKKKCKPKKRKASESVLLTPKEEVDDDSDLSEPLFKFRVKASKSQRSRTMPVNRKFSETSRITELDISELSTGVNDLAIVKVKVEAPEEEYFDCRETTYVNTDLLVCSGSPGFVASESEFVSVNDELKSMASGSITYVCGFNDVSLDDLEDMEFDNEENMPLSVFEVDEPEYVNQPLSILSSLEDVSSIEALTSDFSESQLFLQQTPEEVSDISGGQDSDSTVHDDHFCTNLGEEGSPINHEFGSASLESDYLCLPWMSDSTLSPADHDDDMVTVDTKSPIPEEEQHLTSVNTDAYSNLLNPDNDSFVYQDDSIIQEQSSFVPTNVDLEVEFSDHNQQTDVTSEAAEIRNSNCIETRSAERLPLTRKAISPNSQEKLCQAMKSSEPLDDMDHYKCKEKLYFGEQPENKISSAKFDVADNEPSAHPHQAKQFVRNKVYISPKDLLKKPKICKKGSTPKSLAPKGCLNGPRQCRSLPRLSTGFTSIQGCSENAIAFSQRQMQDVESLASKLMSELNSMKVIIEKKMLYEAYRSPSLKNEADEVKSAIKSATKTEETAKKWLSMMARDCNRFCKIMKLNEDNNPSATAEPVSRSPNQEKPLHRERKKISFADKAGGKLCDIKVFNIKQDSLELSQSSLL